MSRTVPDIVHRSVELEPGELAEWVVAEQWPEALVTLTHLLESRPHERAGGVVVQPEEPCLGLDGEMVRSQHTLLHSSVCWPLKNCSHLLSHPIGSSFPSKVEILVCGSKAQPD